MTHAQREYLKKWLFVFGIVLGVAFMIFCLLSDSWLNLIPLVVSCCVLVTFITVFIVEMVGMAIWRWRLMGECKTVWETKTLDWWWFWMGRSDSWVDYVPTLIEDSFDEDSTEYKMAFDLYERFCAVKKPRCLQ